MPTATHPSSSTTALVPAHLRSQRVVLRLDGELADALTFQAHAHGFIDVHDYVVDLLTDAGLNAHQDCHTCRRVARGGRPALTP